MDLFLEPFVLFAHGVRRAPKTEQAASITTPRHPLQMQCVIGDKGGSPLAMERLLWDTPREARSEE
jgi:hypothetical protein